MATAFRNIERAKEELAQIHGEIVQLERRVDTLHQLLGKAITELFGTDRPAFPALQEAVLRTCYFFGCWSRAVEGGTWPFSLM